MCVAALTNYGTNIVLSSASKLREKRLDVDKCLLNKRSVDDVEWVWRSFHKYLSKNKVPPGAAVNGIQVPPKPAFFDLNELDLVCRLLAPRLAFEKLLLPL